MYCGKNPAEPTVTNCAVSVAVRDIFPMAAVCQTGIWPFYDHNEFILVHLPELVEFINKFDFLGMSGEFEERLNIPELEFEIEIPDEILAKIGNGNVEEVKTIIQNSETLELV